MPGLVPEYERCKKQPKGGARAPPFFQVHRRSASQSALRIGQRDLAEVKAIRGLFLKDCDTTLAIGIGAEF